eukprot:COSAG02_NODE_1043_length_15014_cov_8.766007_11_plen_82_part_00
MKHRTDRLALQLSQMDLVASDIVAGSCRAAKLRHGATRLGNHNTMAQLRHCTRSFVAIFKSVYHGLTLQSSLLLTFGLADF